ncbi:MAG: hypothetical protein K1W09_02025 [Akkermansia muciniphila]|uniref:hypothetical protein n=2 Tax=uncultured Akkermansia sp. TaxID=512294 RepID=UPI00260B79B2|nr:hypothetical protein [uncultured Akkermansia sp.]
MFPIPGMAALSYPPINNERTTIMAIKLIANYSKRLGLPGYSSHQFEVSIETEIPHTSELASETERLYGSLQAAVDAQIQQVGFVPDASYGLGGVSSTARPAIRQVPRLPVPPSSNPRTSHSGEPAWHCSDKQKQVILSLARKNGMNDSALHDLAVLCFGKGTSQLNKLEASSLINELIEKSGRTSRKAPSFGSCARLQEAAAPEMW